MKKQMFGLLAASVLSTGAMAQGGYIGADFGFIDADIKTSLDTASADPTALRFRGGLQLHENLAVEGVVGVGLQDGEIEKTRRELGLDELFGVSAVGIIPLDRTFGLFAKVGYASVGYEYENGSTVDDTGVMFGFGGKLDFDRHGSGMTIEYTILPEIDATAKVESSMISIGAQLAF